MNEEGLAETIKSLDNSSSHLAATVDVRKSASVDSWIGKTIEKFGKLDGAANWAGVIRVNPVVEETDENWNFVMDVNSTGVFNCIRAQLRVMKDGASIVRDSREQTPSHGTPACTLISPCPCACACWLANIRSLEGIGGQYRGPNWLADLFGLLCQQTRRDRLDP